MSDDATTVDLEHGKTETITLEWTSSGDDHGDHLATAASEDTTDTYEFWVAQTFERSTTAAGSTGAGSVSRTLDGDRTTVGSGSGAGSTARSFEGDRVAVGHGDGVGSARRTLEGSRNTETGTARPGSGSTSRSYEGGRSTMATGDGAGSTSRVLEASRSMTPARGSRGSGSTSRSLEGLRTVTATASPGDASSSSVRVSREAVSVRTTVARSSGGAASTSWTAPFAFVIPLRPSDGDSPVVLLEPVEVTTDHDTIDVEALVSMQVVSELEEYEHAGDIDREATAYGAFRRVPRDGSEPFTLAPPEIMSPPFQSRDVVPVDYSASQGPEWYTVEFTFGLEEPRGREPPDPDRDRRRVASKHVSVDHGDAETVTLEWPTAGDDVGVWELEVATGNIASEDSSDTGSATVTDSDFVLAWPVATLNLTEDDVRPVVRGSADGVPRLDLGLDLDATRASIIFSVGSRVDAATIRSVPDGPNVVVDTLPDQELTVDIETPDDVDVDPGTYVLAGWQLTRSDPLEKPYETELELLRQE